MATILETFGANLRAIRTARGLTQRQLSDASGFQQSYLSNLESAKREPTLTCVDRIATALEVPIGKLLKPVKADPEPIPDSENKADERAESSKSS